MPRRRSAGDIRYRRSFREGTASGRRFVSDGKVRIEWVEHGRRRRRTIGPNDPDARRRADAELTAILRALHRTEGDSPGQAHEPRARNAYGDLAQSLRLAAAGLLDIADTIVARLEGVRAEPADEPQQEDTP